MASSPQKTHLLSDERNLSGKPESSGLRNSPFPGLGCSVKIPASFDAEKIAKNPGVRRMFKRVANDLAKGDDDWDVRRHLPIKLLEELVPGFDVDKYCESNRKIRSDPQFIKARQDFLKQFQDPPMSQNINSETPVVVNNPA